MHARFRPGRIGTAFAGLTLALLAGCGGPSDRGALRIELRWQAPEAPAALRGLLSGIVDGVHLAVERKGQPVAEQDCDYDALGCSIVELPAGSGYRLTVEARQADEAVYRGTADDLRVRADEQTEVTVTMEPAYSQDHFPPAPVGDLSAALEGSDVRLSWTATGDDWLVGRAKSYLVYFSTEPLNEDNLDQANPPFDGPSPREAGQSETMLVLGNGLPAGNTCYFALKVVDDDGNESALSNVVSVPLQ